MATDKRVVARRRSQHAIYNAFFQCLATKELTEITVTELIRKSGVARSTFYRQFSSVSEVLEGYIRCSTERFEDSIADCPAGDAHAYLMHVFELFATMGPRLLLLKERGLDGRILQGVIDYLVHRFGDMPSNSPSRYLIYFRAGAVYCVCMEWVRGGMVETPAELSDIVLAKGYAPRGKSIGYRVTTGQSSVLSQSA